MTPVYLLRIENKVRRRKVDTLYCFVAVRDPDATEIATTLSHEVTKNLAPDEIVIICGTPLVALILIGWQQGAFESLSSRLPPSVPLSILPYDQRGRATPIVQLNHPPLAETTLPEVVRRGVTQIFRDRGGFIEPSSSYHFENPSGRHTDRFIRLSNLLGSQAEIAFLALAVMPLLPGDARLAYIDTPALFAIVSSINEQWRYIAPKRRPIVVENFGSYTGVEADPKDGEQSRFDQRDAAVVLISASSSGGLAQRIIKKHAFDATRIVHLLYLGKNPDDFQVAVNLAVDAAANPRGFQNARVDYAKGKCVLCDRGSRAIPLLGDQFDIRGPQLDPLIVQKKDAPDSLDPTMERISSRAILQVSSAARQFVIEAGKLLRTAAYRDRYDFFIRRFVPANVRTCIIDKEATRPYAERIATVSGLPLKIVTRDEIESLNIDPEQFVEPLLVVVDVIGSGRILLEISRDLRNVCPRAPLIYVAGFAKSASAVSRDRLKKNLTQTHHSAQHAFEVVDGMMLPDNELSNAWLDEIKLLQSSRSRWDPAARTLLQVRLDRLREAGKPMVNDLFVSNDIKPLGLQAGFAFWSKPRPKASQADVYYTIAAILQTLRTKPPGTGGQALRTNWLQQTLLSPENFGRFNDGVIQACLLRASNPAELEYEFEPKLSQDAARLIRRVLEAAGQSRGEAAAEFLIALATRRLTLSDDELRAVLRPLDGAPPLVAALLAIARQKLLVKKEG